MVGSKTRSAAFLVLALLLILSVSGCGGPPGVVIVGTARAPGADGLIDAEKTGENGSLVRIHMERLPAPEQLGEGLKYYLVWFETKGVKPIRAGTLTYQSESRTGDLMKACAFREFRVTITAERLKDASVPSELAIAERAVKAE